MSSIREHIMRVPLPWRSQEEALTECGLVAAQHTTLTYDAMEAKVKREGQQRASLSSCMTCWRVRAERASELHRHGPDFTAVEREVARVRFRNPEESVRLGREFRAIALLVAAHREEFDTILRDMDEAIDLTAARRNRKPPLHFNGLRL